MSGYMVVMFCYWIIRSCCLTVTCRYLIVTSGYKIDSELKFDKHVPKLCSKASRKLISLYRLPKFLSFDNRKKPFEAFVESQLYNNNKINRLHEWAPRIAYVDYQPCFEQLLEKDRWFILILKLFRDQ